MDFLLLALGLFVLWLGAELAIRGAIDISKHFGISQTFTGLTILALGTDLPELFVNVSASLKSLQGQDTSGLILGDVIGSCFGQVGLALGILAVLNAVSVQRREITRDGFMLIFATALLLLLASNGSLSRVDATIFLLVYIYYFVTILREEKIKRSHLLFRKPPELHSMWSGLSLVSGVALLAFGSDATINAALDISETFGLAQRVVGILLVGFGTSIPEVAASLAAIRHKAHTMAAANLFGSNIFDLLFTLGVSGVISEFAVHPNLIAFDVPVLLMMHVVVVFFLITRQKLSRWEGVAMITGFVAYFAYTASSGTHFLQ